jgi:hypothetical protein
MREPSLTFATLAIAATLYEAAENNVSRLLLYLHNPCARSAGEPNDCCGLHADRYEKGMGYKVNKYGESRCCSRRLVYRCFCFHDYVYSNKEMWKDKGGRGASRLVGFKQCSFLGEDRRHSAGKQC